MVFQKKSTKKKRSGGVLLLLGSRWRPSDRAPLRWTPRGAGPKDNSKKVRPLGEWDAPFDYFLNMQLPVKAFEQLVAGKSMENFHG